jgi:predicted acylesterase/phospholipase RssA
MKLGFSLSPGGLLLPYHMGALQCLQYERVLEPHQSIVAGSSAGSIAAMAYGCGISPHRALEGTIEISDRCATMGRAQGKLLPLLEEQMESLVGDQEFEYLLGGGGGGVRNIMTIKNSGENIENENDDDNSIPTNIGIAYTQIFPQRKGYLQRSFTNRLDLFRAVRFSCMFPFFTTPWPCLVDTDQTKRFPRLMVDGYFSVPRDQFGCHFLCDTKASALENRNLSETDQTNNNRAQVRPRLLSTATTSTLLSSSIKGTKADRTIAISCFPQDLIGMTAFSPDNCISPTLSSTVDEPTTAMLSNLFRIATQPTSRKELTDIFELGYQNAETWCRNEATKVAYEQQQQREANRMLHDV